MSKFVKLYNTVKSQLPLTDKELSSVTGIPVSVIKKGSNGAKVNTHYFKALKLFVERVNQPHANNLKYKTTEILRKVLRVYDVSCKKVFSRENKTNITTKAQLISDVTKLDDITNTLKKFNRTEVEIVDDGKSLRFSSLK